MTTTTSATVGGPASRVGGLVTQLEAARTLTSHQLPAPTAADGEALVRVLACGVCGTDVHAFTGRSDRLPMTLGHDAVGIVDALGAGPVPDGIAVGGRVTIDPSLWCGNCHYCRNGARQLCSAGGYLGMTQPGTMADFIVVPTTNLVALPDALCDLDATVLEPVAVGLHVLERIVPFAPPGLGAAVVGGGPLGLVLAQTLAAKGWTPVVYEKQSHRRTFGLGLGLDVQPVESACRRDGPALIVETSAAASGIDLVRTLAAPGSVVALVGRAPAQLTSAEILELELTVLGIRAGVGCYPEAIALAASNPQVTPGAVITHEYRLGELSSAFDAVADPQAAVMRAVIRMGPG